MTTTEPANVPVMLKCPTCGEDDSFTSWEQTTTGYAGVRFFVAPDGSGRDIDYDGTNDYQMADDGGGEFQNDITCTNCDTLNLTIESLLGPDGKPAEPGPVAVDRTAELVAEVTDMLRIRSDMDLREDWSTDEELEALKSALRLALTRWPEVPIL